MLTSPSLKLVTKVTVGHLLGHIVLLLEHELTRPLEGVVVVNTGSRGRGEVGYGGEVIRKEDRL